MAVSKPGWLTRALDLLNWDIFTWKVYIGDAVERGIDWTLEWVNWGIDQATLAYNKAVDAWDKALEVYRDLRSWVNTELQRAGNLIDAAKSFLLERIRDIRSAINSVDVWLDNFRRDTLPKLLDTQWVRDFFGKGISTINDWWAARRGEIDNRLDAEITPVRDEVNRRASIFGIVKNLVTDPLDWADHFVNWASGWIEAIIARLW